MEVNVAGADERDAVRGRDAGDPRNGEGLVLIGSVADGQEGVVEIRVAAAGFVDEVGVEDVRLAEAPGEAVVCGRAGAEAGLVSRNAARIFESVGPVARAEEELVAGPGVVVEAAGQIVVSGLLLPAGEVVLD